MTDSTERLQLPRLPTGISGLDEITSGGLPVGGVTLVAGVSGSGKTVLAMQFLVEGIRRFQQPGVFVTFGERPNKLARFVAEFGWDLASLVDEGCWAFVDASDPDVPAVILGEELDFTVLESRIAAAVQRVGARRVALDSLNDLLSRFGDRASVRHGVVHLIEALEQMGVTTVATVARRDDYGDITPHGVEEFVADNILLLRNPLAYESRRRTIEVLKFRGTTHRRGEYPFAITASNGLVVIPLTISIHQPVRDDRVSSGNAALDEMLGGGLFRDSVTLVSGPTGVGKTVLALTFLQAAINAGEKAVFAAFEESSEQLSRTLRAWDLDLVELQREGSLVLLSDYPEVASLEEHLVRIKNAIERIGADRLVVDSVTTVQRAGSMRSYQEFAVGLTAYLKERHVTGLLTTLQPSLAGGMAVTPEHVSLLSDGILLLRYVEVQGEVRRSIMALKHRGSWHSKEVREFTIEPDGIRVGARFQATTGILEGAVSDIAGSARPNHGPPTGTS